MKMSIEELDEVEAWGDSMREDQKVQEAEASESIGLLKP